MTIETFDGQTLESLGCLRGMLAVYDNSYLLQDNGKIYEIAKDFRAIYKGQSTAEENPVDHSCIIYTGMATTF